jgi:hypothetical protein
VWVRSDGRRSAGAVAIAGRTGRSLLAIIDAHMVGTMKVHVARCRSTVANTLAGDESPVTITEPPRKICNNANSAGASWKRGATTSSRSSSVMP